MNPVIKFAYRTYQAVFKLAIPVMPYRPPLILDSVRKVPEILQKEGADCVLLITDSFLHASGILNPLKTALSQHGIGYAVYDETVPNPTVSNVEAARALYQRENCKALIGFGGGSAIDCAKAVGARIARPNKSIPEMEGILQVMRKIPYLIAIPTTAGTGSETTLAMVITDDSNGHKFPINDFALIPKAAVLDPEMTRTLPPGMTATTGMDALTHAIEAYIGRSTVRETRENALKAAELIAENLENAYRDADDLTARSNMLMAAFLAGRAFSKSYVGYCHAVAHSLGGKYRIPHGLANAVLLPYVLEAYGCAIYKKGKRLAVAMHLVNSGESEESATRKLIDHIRKMNRDMGIPTKLKGIQKEDIPQLAAYAAKEANPLYPVPVLMTSKELERFYYDVMEEAI